MVSGTDLGGVPWVPLNPTTYPDFLTKLKIFSPRIRNRMNFPIHILFPHLSKFVNRFVSQLVIVILLVHKAFSVTETRVFVDVK